LHTDNPTSIPTWIPRKLLCWKYLLPLLILQGVLLYTYLSFPKGTGSLGLVIIGVLYYFSRKVSLNDQGEKIRSWQWIAFMVYLLITIALGLGIYKATVKPVSSGFHVQGYVDNLVKTVSSKVPLKMSNHNMMFKVIKKDDHSFIYHVRSTKYTRMELLQPYNNDPQAFQVSTLKQELSIYCNNKAVREPLQAGIVIYERFYGSQDPQPIIQLRIDEAACRAYEKSIQQ